MTSTAAAACPPLQAQSLVSSSISRITFMCKLLMFDARIKWQAHAGFHCWHLKYLASVSLHAQIALVIWGICTSLPGLGF